MAKTSHGAAALPGRVAAAKRGNMDNKTALVLALMVLCFLAVDYIYYSMALSAFLFMKLVALIDEISFWR